MNSDGPTRQHFPTINRFQRLLFSRRFWRASIFLLIVLITLIALLYALENRRGRRAIDAFKKEVESRGETLDLATLAPAEVPAHENFADTPFVRACFAVKGGGNQDALTNLWPEKVHQASARLRAPVSGERQLTDL